MDSSQIHRSGLPRPGPSNGARPLAGDYWGKGWIAVAASRAGDLTAAANSSCAPIWMACSSLVLIYSVAVLTHVAAMGTIGVRCMFRTMVEEEIPADYVWKELEPQPDGGLRPIERQTPGDRVDAGRPRIGDWLLSIGGFDIHEKSYADYIHAPARPQRSDRQQVEVSWRIRTPRQSIRRNVLVQRPPSWTYYRSCVWFLQELLIFAIGARVFWKRPDDESAQLFFAVCIVTVGAFMGGYHWTEIVTEPGLIYPFALSRCFVPVVNLHFSWCSRDPIRFWCGTGGWSWRLYGITTAYLVVALGGHARGPLARRFTTRLGDARRRFNRPPPGSRGTSPWRRSSRVLHLSA